MLRFTPVLFLLLAATVSAQNTPLPVPPNPVPVPIPSAVPAPVVTPRTESVRLQLFELKAVLDAYERLTKKRLVTDTQAVGNLPISIIINGDVTRDEAIRIIETSLILNGITLVPAERSDIVKVIGGKNPRSAGIPIISDEAAIPDGEQIITFLAKLQYADPTELAQTLSLFQPAGLVNGVIPLSKSQALLITDNTAVLRGLLRIIHEVDIRPADVVSEFLVLERADAKDVLEKLTKIFEKQPSGTAAPTASPRGVQVPRPPNVTPDGIPLPPGATAETTSPNSVEISAGALSEDSIIVGKIKLTADVRTNRIHVVTRPVNLPFIRKLISEFDSSALFGKPVSRPLKFISANDILDVLANSIADTGVKPEKMDGSGTPTGGSGAGGATGNTGSLLGNNTGNGNTGGGSGGASVGGSELDTAEVDTKPEGRIVGTTKIIADKNANAIIIVGSADAQSKLFKLLDQLDQRIPQVMIHAVIGELSLNSRVQFGVDYILRNAGLGISPLTVTGGTTTDPTTGVTTTTPGTSTTTGTNLAAFSSSNQPSLNLGNLLNQNTVNQIATAGGSGLTGYFTAGNSLTAIVTALENTGRFTVVNRPSVFTRNNKKAIIASGQEIAVPQNIQSSINSVNAGNAGVVTNSSVQYKNVTLQLEIVPTINSEKEVSLEILQRNNEVSGSTRIDNNDIPTISTRYVRTSVTLPNEATLILGGLIRSSINKTKGGIPILSSIPLIGPLFGTTIKEKIRSELVILIRPEVTWAPPDAAALREREMQFMNLPPDLESTIYPEIKVRKTTPESMLRKGPAPVREKAKSAKFKP